jgi:hypothetical protein
MDGDRIDAIARRLAGLRSRRAVLAAAVGGVLATAGLAGSGGDRTTAAPGCRPAGSPCEGNQQCCAGLVCAATGPGAPRRCTPAPTATVTRTPTPRPTATTTPVPPTTTPTPGA